MAVCRHPFGTLQSLPPSPELLDGTIDFSGPPTVFLSVNFSVNMNTGLTPTAGEVIIMVDGAPRPMLNWTWTTTTEAQLSYTGNDPTSTGTVTIPVTTPNLISDNDIQMPAPQTANWFP